MKKHILRLRTTCPHCGENTFSAIRFNTGNLAMNILDIATREEIVSGNISLGGPGVAVYFKRCLNCGFIAPFDAKIVEDKGRI